MARKKQSPKWRVNKADLKKWSSNTLIFLAPALVVLLASFKDVIPQEASWGVIALFTVNVLTDFLRKLMKE